MISPADILNARILVVDDAAVNVLLIDAMLRGAGYTNVTTTTDSTTVRTLYAVHHYDLIVLDVQMPGLDGFQVMERLKDVETEGYLPVLVLTAHREHMLLALQAGAKDFISKPFDRVEMLTRIHNMLEVRLLLRASKDHGRLLEQYDQVTGLPNRTLFRRLLTRALDRTDGLRKTVSVLIVDLDRFQQVNETLGHHVGDTVLRLVADRLTGCLGPMDTAARLDGDAFGLIVTADSRDPHGAEVAVTNVRTALAAPLDADGHTALLTASIGIAVASTDAPDADTLMKYAETALHEAKSAGQGSHRFYWPATAGLERRAAIG